MPNLSAWRVNDVVAYDAMLEVAGTLTALLLNIARAGGDDALTARRELAEVRHAVLAVDGYDRAAVEALATRLRARIGDLSGAAS
ncbi:hypothetical protein ACPW96_16700 [Micromonospora sp. DT81.3]|uniref:hypothetical protein n=1 Tax=Micromonospora sp. DT81.3 TaxID=3416523 RepID=UPI003CE8F015